MFRFQSGGAIVIKQGSNNRADFGSCTLSGNQAKGVCRHAAQGAVFDASVHAAIGALVQLLAHACKRSVGDG